MKRAAIQNEENNSNKTKIKRLESTASDNKGESNKKLVTDFMTNCWIANNYEDAILTKYISKDVKFHNSKIGNGWEGARMCKDAFKDLELIKLIAGEDDTVIVHGKCNWNGTEVMFTDIWRIDENGLLAECWIVIQKVS